MMFHVFESWEIERQNQAELVESMNDMNEDVQSIGKIVQLINDISDQTNLLALNASIEDRPTILTKPSSPLMRSLTLSKNWFQVSKQLNPILSGSLKKKTWFMFLSAIFLLPFLRPLLGRKK